MKRDQLRATFAGWGTMAALSLAMALPAGAQQGTGAKGESILPETDPTANQSFVKQRGIKVEWLPFGNLNEVINNSHVIVHGKVVEQRTVMQATDKDVPLTISTVLVNKMVRRMAEVTSVSGKQVNAGQRIEIVELGGRMPDGSMLEPEAAPVLRQGDEALFFLRSQQIDLSGQNSAVKVRPGAYHVTGGFQGRWAIGGGQVHPLSTQTEHRGFLDNFDGRPVEDVVKELKEMPIQPQLLPRAE
jgi:hypothetical protein